MNQDKKSASQQEENDWANLSHEEIIAITDGLADIENGRTLSHAEVMSRIEKKLDILQNSKSL